MAGMPLAFNAAVCRAEDRVLRVAEGTLAESWRVQQPLNPQALNLQLK